MKAKPASTTRLVQGEFQYPIYSPKGAIEGALLRVDGDVVQLVFEPHGDPSADTFVALRPGDRVSVQVHAAPPSDKGDAQHAVCRFERLVAVNGLPHASAALERQAPYSGTVVRLNFARHGEANGVVLDSGHFIHTRPDGMAQLQLAVGDRVDAEGDARPLVNGAGMVVEAITVNGQTVGKRAPHGKPKTLPAWMNA